MINIQGWRRLNNLIPTHSMHVHARLHVSPQLLTLVYDRAVHVADVTKSWHAGL